MEQTKRLLISGNLIQAHIWKGLLESSYIDVEMRGEALIGGIGELPTDLQSVELWVTQNQFQLAEDELAALQTKTEPWWCSHCHEKNEPSFEICWNCQGS
ncbi:DUF2007 domain-containing protein [Vibrio sp. SS-MA-C1-2]|uniref:putative signal transducing protein n=1 Tax=Vibrio sp. SS-MA-C1-2 TaxID=2908646 RepID=UPI001F3EE070|nr:DUF2007 domain-containing protein [Vibrio sp. SS-MA-C1-2]UJF16833.1 DUF2007 domain-containing protein [Vibrio sp. SS-MA-C1-2]